jgi:thiamine kinase
LHASIHECSMPDLPPYAEVFGHAIKAARWLPEGLRPAVLRRLDSLPGGDSLCHGDMHPGNIVMTSRGPIIIDWMTAARGHPLADVARSIVLIRSGPPGLSGVRRRLLGTATGLFQAAYLQRYGELRPLDRDLLAAWLPVVAAARMDEQIEGQRDWLLGIVERLARQAL